MKRRSFWLGDSSGAVAPTVALALFALLGAGGVAFDYARLVTIDTEMQNAADQAALAAATQLDQQANAVARATAAAQGLLANQTLMANDGNVSGRAVTVVVRLNIGGWRRGGDGVVGFGSLHVLFQFHTLIGMMT